MTKLRLGETRQFGQCLTVNRWEDWNIDPIFLPILWNPLIFLTYTTSQADRKWKFWAHSMYKFRSLWKPSAIEGIPYGSRVIHEEESVGSRRLKRQVWSVAWKMFNFDPKGNWVFWLLQFEEGSVIFKLEFWKCCCIEKLVNKMQELEY